MAEAKETPRPIEIARTYEQPADAISFFSDFMQIINTGNEIVIQAYETIPGPPTPGTEAKITKITTRLRATITIGMSHATNIGNLLIKKTQESKK